MSPVDIQLGPLGERVAERQITLEVPAEARAYLARVGNDPIVGARSLKRVIQLEIETPVARLIVAGKFGELGTVRFDVVGDTLRSYVQ